MLEVDGRKLKRKNDIRDWEGIHEEAASSLNITYESKRSPKGCYKGKVPHSIRCSVFCSLIKCLLHNLQKINCWKFLIFSAASLPPKFYPLLHYLCSARGSQAMAACQNHSLLQPWLQSLAWIKEETGFMMLTSTLIC